MTDTLLNWIRHNYLELFGVASGLLYIYLEIKQKSTMWIVGFFTSTVYIFVFFRSKFYADMALNVYYVIMSIYGWYCWRYAQKPDGVVAERGISQLKWRLGVVLMLISAVLYGGMGYVLDNYTDSPVPYYDALTTALSITATWMLAQKIIEHWYLWIFINFFSSVLYLWRDLHPTAVLFLIYGVMSIVGWRKWNQSFKTATNGHSSDLSIPDSNIS